MSIPAFIALYREDCSCGQAAYRLMQVRDLRGEQDRIKRFAFRPITFVASMPGNWRTMETLHARLGVGKGETIALPEAEILRVMRGVSDEVSLAAQYVRDTPAGSPTPTMQPSAKPGSRERGYELAAIARQRAHEDKREVDGLGPPTRGEIDAGKRMGHSWVASAL